MKNKFTILQFNLSFIGLAIAFIALPFSIKVCHAGIILFLLMWAIEGDWSNKIRIIRGSYLLHLIAGLFVLNVFGLFYSQNLYNGWLVIERKIFFLLLPLAIATSAKHFTAYHINKLFHLFIFACFTGSVIALWSSLNTSDQALLNDYLLNTDFSGINKDIPKSWFTFSYVSLAEGIQMHPTFFSLYIAFCIVLLFREIITNQLATFENVVIGMLIVYFVTFMICLSSRIVIGTLFLIVAGYIAYELRYAPIKRNAIVVAMLIPFISFVLYINPVSRYRSHQALALTTFSLTNNTEYNNSVNIRLSLWSLACRSINASNLVTGTGTGDVKTIMEESGKRYAVSNVLNTYDPHNQFLFDLLGHGLLGLTLLILVFVLPMYYAWRQRDYLYLVFALLCASVCLTESAFELQKGIVFYSLINSLLLLRVDGFKLFKQTAGVVS